MESNKKSLKQRIEDQVIWSKDAQGAWCGQIVFKDGYRVSIAAGPDMNMRTAKSCVREHLFREVPRIAAERNTDIM